MAWKRRSDCRSQRCAKDESGGGRRGRDRKRERCNRFISWSLRLVLALPFHDMSSPSSSSLSVCQFGITSPPPFRLLKTGIHSATGFRSPGEIRGKRSLSMRVLPVLLFRCATAAASDRLMDTCMHTQLLLCRQIKLLDALHFG